MKTKLMTFGSLLAASLVTSAIPAWANPAVTSLIENARSSGQIEDLQEYNFSKALPGDLDRAENCQSLSGAEAAQYLAQDYLGYDEDARLNLAPVAAYLGSQVKLCDVDSTEGRRYLYETYFVTPDSEATRLYLRVAGEFEEDEGEGEGEGERGEGDWGDAGLEADREEGNSGTSDR